MEKLSQALLVTLIGISIVFLGLVILIMLIKIMQILTAERGDKAAAPAPKPAPVPAPAPVMQEIPVNANDELIAVITAAVAMMMEGGSGFTVRRVRRVNNAPAWQKAGREEQICSHF